MLIREYFLEESKALGQEDTVCFLLVFSDPGHSENQEQHG